MKNITINYIHVEYCGSIFTVAIKPDTTPTYNINPPDECSLITED